MSTKKKILIIDDDPDTLTYFSSLLEDEGYETKTVENGELGLVALKTWTPDLITLDVTMPEMSGIKFYRTLKEAEQTKAIPIIIITGVSGEFEKFISTRKQVPPPDGYLAKPIDQGRLLEQVHKLLNVSAV
ncbi:response regulator [bacterium]|nr:response regulator [bacterium]